jgi:hypothetical protein
LIPSFEWENDGKIWQTDGEKMGKRVGQHGET